MLDFLGEKEASLQVEEAVKRVVREKLKSLSAGKMGYTTQEVGDLVVKML